MSDFKSEFDFQDCWSRPTKARTVSNSASGYFDVPSKKPNSDVSGPPKGSQASSEGSSKGGSGSISAADKARLARVVKGAPEVMVKVSRPAKNDKRGNPIHVTRATEAVRMAEHLSYISRNGKIELENDRGEKFDGKQDVATVYREWLDKHDDDLDHKDATNRTRMTTSIVFSMPGSVNAEAVKDSVRAVAAQ